MDMVFACAGMYSSCRWKFCDRFHRSVSNKFQTEQQIALSRACGRPNQREVSTHVKDYPALCQVSSVMIVNVDVIQKSQKLVVRTYGSVQASSPSTILLYGR